MQVRVQVRVQVRADASLVVHLLKQGVSSKTCVGTDREMGKILAGRWLQGPSLDLLKDVASGKRQECCLRSCQLLSSKSIWDQAELSFNSSSTAKSLSPYL